MRFVQWRLNLVLTQKLNIRLSFFTKVNYKIEYLEPIPAHSHEPMQKFLSELYFSTIRRKREMRESKCGKGYRKMAGR